MVIGPKGSTGTSTSELILASVQPTFRAHLEKVNREFKATCAQRQQARSQSSAPPAASAAIATTCSSAVSSAPHVDPQIRTSISAISALDNAEEEHSCNESDWMSQDDCWAGGPEVEGLELEFGESDIQ